jgi:hypothetical protein
MTDDLSKAVRMACIRAFAKNTHSLLEGLVETSRATGDTGLVLAALHLQDSFAAFSAACERSIEKDTDAGE